MKDPIVYFDGGFMPKSEVRISPDDRGFLFADGVYEVFRSYHGKFFYINEHLQRLAHSLNEIQINVNELKEIPQIAQNLLHKNNLTQEDVIVYIQITRGEYTRMHRFPTKNTKPTVYITAYETITNEQEKQNGIKVVTSVDTRWKRCDIKSIGLLANVLAKQHAYNNDGYEGVFVKDGIITEGTHTGVFGIANGTLITHPQTNHILPSITRGIVMNLCDKLKIPVTESLIYKHKVHELDELFIVGTTPEITPAIQIDEITIGNGKPGEITKQLQKEYKNLVSNL